MTDKLPVAIIIPHAGGRIPPEVVGRVALTDAQIFNEADAYADLLYDFRGQVQHWLCFPWARAVIDVNRLPESAANRLGDGIVKERTSYGAPVYLPGQAPGAALTQALVARYWQPWVMVEISRGLYIGPQTGDTPVPATNETVIMEIRCRLWQGINKLIRQPE